MNRVWLLVTSCLLFVANNVSWCSTITAQKVNFALRNSSVNVTKSTVSCGVKKLMENFSFCAVHVDVFFTYLYGETFSYGVYEFWRETSCVRYFIWWKLCVDLLSLWHKRVTFSLLFLVSFIEKYKWYYEAPPIIMKHYERFNRCIHSATAEWALYRLKEFTSRVHIFW